jgi:glycosyltransferase involved in cell wall biosynthesis
VEVHTVTPERARPEDVLSPADEREFATTYAWRPIRPLHHLRAHADALVRRRGAYLVALRRSWSRRRAGVRSKIWHLAYFAQGVVLWHRCRLAGVRHIHVHFANSSSDIAMAAVELGGDGWSWSLNVHGPAEFYDVPGFQVATKVDDARFVVCISDFCRSQLMAFADPAGWDKLRVVHCGVDVASLAPACGPAKTDGDALDVVCVGRLVPVKGQLVLLEAVARLRADGIDTRLTLVGEGPSRPQLEARIAELGLGEHVEITGAVAHPRALAWVASADVFCLASFAEGVPVSLMEAMALGVPVVSTRIMGIPELIADGESGLLVPPGDADRLTAALTALARDPSLRARLAAAGRQAVETEFDVDRTTEQLLELFTTHVGAR